MFERPKGGERAVLVHIDFGQGNGQNGGYASDQAEFKELVRSTGAEVVDLIAGSRRSPDARHFIGKGKVNELKERVAATNAEVVIFNHTLGPGQERNLESVLSCQVLDRTGLILDIFAQRARSHEGKLQVELAQLRHLSTRLIRGWTHLERQKGGIGMRGPGEKQLETDRRLLAERIKTIQHRLAKVSQQRNQGRQARHKAEIPTVSLVGYTNAGKSTVFNALSGADVYAADQLFATLDPTLRRVQMPGGLPVVLADTVGFIRQLPHDLVVAFRSTLQETEEADLLLHIIDASDLQRDQNIDQVNRVLREINASDRIQILVYNKIDLTDLPPKVTRSEDGRLVRVWVSGKTGAGLDLLSTEITRFFQGQTLHGLLTLPMSEGRLRAELFEHGVVLAEEITPSGEWRLEVRVSNDYYQRLTRQNHVLTLESVNI